MPEISDSDFRQFVAYQQIGTPQEIANKVTDLEGDNKTQRDEIRDLKAKLPKETDVVLPKEKAETLAAYEALGKPEDLKTVVTEVGELRTKDATRTREDAFRGAVKAMGWSEETVATLLDMRSLEGAKVEVRKEKGKDARGAEAVVEIPYLTLAGDGQKEQKFAEFAASTPQLKGINVTGGTTSTPTTPTFPRQAASGAPARTDLKAEDHRAAVASQVDYSAI